MFRSFDLKEQFIVAECMRFIKPLDYSEINSAPSELYHLPEHKLDVVITIMEILKIYGNINGIDKEDRERLLEFAKLGSHFKIMELKD